MKQVRKHTLSLSFILFLSYTVGAQENLTELYYSGNYGKVIDLSSQQIQSGDTAVNTYYLKALAESQFGQTGASITTLHRNVVDRLKIRNAQKASIMVAGGSTINADVVKFDYVKVGPNKKENIYASIIDHKGVAVAHQGLLGMNFLQGLDYRVDFKRQMISWK